MRQRHEIRRRLKQIVGALAGAYILGVTFLWVFQRQLLFTPDGRPSVAPSYYSMLAGVQAVTLETADGLQITAWYAPAPEGRPTVVMFLGKSESLRGQRYRLKFFEDAAMGVLMLAYRGYSGNPGTPTERGLYTDARAALDWLASIGVAGESIAVYGQSLGTGVATEMAVERELGAVVLEAPYTSTIDVAADRLPFVPVRWLMRDRFDSLARIARVTEPLLVMHGDRDTVVRQSLGRRLYDAANEPKEGFWPAGLGHHDLCDNGGFAAARDFIERRLGAPRRQRAEGSPLARREETLGTTAR